MLIKFWGVRGSTPTPQPENMRYGGNTSCVEVRFGEQIYIFDCGTGFRVLGQQLQSEFGERPFCAHVFVSHFHWDHIQGMPFFRQPVCLSMLHPDAEPETGSGRTDGAAVFPRTNRRDEGAP
jgi:phosphoribosyl 1,2-cyclic phosphodiesterase